MKILLPIIFSFLGIAFISESCASISGTVYIGTGMQYTSLTKNGGLFAAINADTVSGDIIAMIATDLEENAAKQLNQWVESGIGNYRLYIVPVDTATVVKNITGYLGSSALSLITFNGADRVVIDGSLNQSGRYLRFRAINNSYGGVFRFRNGSSQDTLRNCLVDGGSTSTVNVIIFDVSNVAGGNSNNAVIGCIIRDNPDIITARMDYGILSNSSSDTLYQNRKISIINNEIFNFRTSGIRINNGSRFTISGNSFYYNAPTTYTYQITIIEVSSGNGHRISDNFMGGSGPNCSGTPWSYNNTGFFGIRILNAATDPPINIINNKFQNLILSGGYPEWGIYVGGLTNIDSISGNIIGSVTDSSSITFPSTADFCGIRLDYDNGIIRHVTGNIIANIVTLGTSCGTSLVGIKIMATSGQNDTLNISNNQICKMYSAMSCNSQTPVFCGIDNRSALSRIKFSGNVIYDLWKIGNGQQTDYVCGFYSRNDNAGGLIEKNKIYGIYNTSVAGAIQGVYLTGGSWTLRNNFIALSNGEFTNQITIYGIMLDFVSTFVNVVVIANTIITSGTSINQYDKAHCIYANTIGTLDSYNNIHVNLRNGPGQNFVYYISPFMLYNGDYNCLFSANTIFSTYNNSGYNSITSWTIATDQEHNSLNFNPEFVNPALGDLHLVLPADSILLNKGIPVSGLSEDIDGESRSAEHPDLGADEISTPQICGRVFYDNSDSTALSDCQVFLMDENNIPLDSTTTNTTGNFCFYQAQAGDYHISVSCDKPWGGANATDAMKILQHYVGMSFLQGLPLEAARINADAFINSSDALLVMRRFVGQITGFENNDWIFASPEFTFGSFDIQVNIPGLCTGDVNGSFTP